MTKNWHLVPYWAARSFPSLFFFPRLSLSFSFSFCLSSSPLFSNTTLYNLETRSFLLLLPLRAVRAREMLIIVRRVTAFTLNVPPAFCFSKVDPPEPRVVTRRRSTVDFFLGRANFRFLPLASVSMRYREESKRKKFDASS